MSFQKLIEVGGAFQSLCSSYTGLTHNHICALNHLKVTYGKNRTCYKYIKEHECKSDVPANTNNVNVVDRNLLKAVIMMAYAD